MTAGVITRTRSEQEIISHALALLDWADSLPLPGCCYDAIGGASEELRDAIELHDLIRAGDIHPASEYEDLGYGHPDNAMELALERAAGAVRDWDRELARAIGGHFAADAARRRAA